MTRPSRRHRLEYLTFRLVRSTLQMLPEAWALGLGSALGWVAGSLLRIRRAVVDQNLARAFPARDRRWRRRVAVASYRHLGREAVATFRFSGDPPEAMASRTEVRGLEHVEEARAAGRGVLLVTGHLGNWEVGGAAIAVRGVPIDAVALRQRNRLFDRDLVENRAGLGIRVIPSGEAPRGVLRSLGEGRVPALVADQNAGTRGVFVDFFGVPASTARGPAVFSLRSGAPLVLGVGIALPGRPHRYRIHLEPVRFEPRGEVSEDIRALTRAHTAALERWVREHPEQYFWQHKRWKARAPAGTKGPEGPPGERPADAVVPTTRNRSPPDGL